METGTEMRQQPGLQAEIAIPDHTFEKRVDEGDDQRRGAQLRGEPGTLSDPSGNDRGNRCGKGQQEEELDQPVAVIAADLRRRVQKVKK